MKLFIHHLEGTKISYTQVQFRVPLSQNSKKFERVRF